MIIRCAVCKKQVVVQWPELWGYKRKNRFMCSWKCLREFDNKEKGAKDVYTKTKKDGTPAKTPGPKAKKELNIGKDEVKATPPTVKLDGAIRIETPEAHNVDIVETPEQAVIKNKVVDIMEELKIRNPLQYEEFTVREVEGLFGRYRRSDIGQETYIDFEPPECVDVISNTLTQWSSFMKELKRAAQVLGVEL